jgi:gelsolin
MADANGDVKGAKLEDSNMANYGSKEHIAIRKKAAQTEKEFVGTGEKPGLEIWRVENRRTASDTPDFGVKRWPKEEYGSFYSGDSYLLLNTYKVKVDGKETDKLAWDVHFWLGKDSTQDEIGVAAYKAVEIDDLLDQGPVQHREVQGYESQLFLSYFPKGIHYMEGGIGSGFRHVKPEEYQPRLFEVHKTGHSVRAFQVPVSIKSMNQGDVFILDAGLKVYTFFGKESNAFEKAKGGSLADNIVAGRDGKATVITEPNADFWKILGGEEKDVSPPLPEKKIQEEEALDANKVKLYQLSDRTGKMTFSKVAEGKVKLSMLKADDVFILDGKVQLFVWIGKNATFHEKSQSMKYAMEYLKIENRPATLPITRITEGQVHHVFGSIVEQ